MKKVCIIAASIAIIISLALGLSLILYPQLSALLLIGDIELSKRNSSGFDLEGTVTDDAGNPLNGVTMKVVFSRRSKLMDFNSPYVNKDYSETVNSKFQIRRKRFTDVEVIFSKNGYYLETLRYGSNGAVNVQHGIQVRMAKRSPVANMQCGGGPLSYSMKNEEKQVCEIWLSETGDVNDYRKKTIDSGALPESTRYFDFDFKRDENGRTEYGSLLYEGAPCPVAFIVRFHSDDPDDGMILMQESSPGMTREDFDTRRNTAPETGYTVKEIEIPMAKREEKIYVFLKCGGHYGKAEISPVRISVDDKGKSVSSAGTSIGISINRTPGDRNVTCW